MEEKIYYMVHQGDGLKTHISTDRKGEVAICGHKIKHYDKKISRIEEPVSLMILAGTGRICERCIEASGLDEIL